MKIQQNDGMVVDAGLERRGTSRLAAGASGRRGGGTGGGQVEVNGWLGAETVGGWISRAGAPPADPIYKGGKEGSRIHAPGASLSPCNTSPSRRSLAKPCRDRCCIHHHAVVVLDLHQPLLPPCWIKKEETSR